MHNAERQALLKTFKTFYFVVTLAFTYKTTHLTYFLVSEWGSTKNIDEIENRAEKRAKDITAALSKEHGIPYQFIEMKRVPVKDYAMLRKYITFTHYIDASLRFYDTSGDEDESNESDE